MTDDAIMEEVYEYLRLVPRMWEPKDTRKRAAFLLAHKMLDKAREYLEEPYRKGPCPNCGGLLEAHNRDCRCTCSYHESEEMTRHAPLCAITKAGGNW